MLPLFELVSPRNLDDAVRALAALGSKSVVLAGGTDVLVQMQSGQIAPEYLVDIKGLDELKAIEYDPGGGMRIGALATHRDLETSRLIRERLAILHDAVSRVGSVQVRNRGTIGGNICNALPSADSVGPLLALGASLRIRGPKGERHVAVEDFFLGPRRTTLASDEILTHVIVPPHSGCGAYIKLARRKAMDLALLGVSVYVERDGAGRCQDVRIALTTAAPVPMRAYEAERSLKGQIMTNEALTRAGEIASQEARPRSSWRSTEAYRRRMIAVLVPRAASLALERLAARA